MGTYLEITSGPSSGKNYELFEGLKIGRTLGDVILEDPKVSAFHAEVGLDNKNQLILYDRGSSNGLRVAGKKVSKIALLPGVEFAIGSSSFRVLEAQQVNPITVEPRRDWREKLQGHLLILEAKNKPSGNPLIHPFPQLLELEFIQGPQLEERYVLGYGPRDAGYFSLDIPLKESGWPDRAFVLSWARQKGGAHIQNLIGDALKINGQSFISYEITGGEELSFQDTIIKFRLRDPNV